jgi:hypothetical protein
MYLYLVHYCLGLIKKFVIVGNLMKLAGLFFYLTFILYDLIYFPSSWMAECSENHASVFAWWKAQTQRLWG